MARMRFSGVPILALSALFAFSAESHAGTLTNYAFVEASASDSATPGPVTNSGPYGASAESGGADQLGNYGQIGLQDYADASVSMVGSHGNGFLHAEAAYIASYTHVIGGDYVVGVAGAIARAEWQNDAITYSGPGGMTTFPPTLTLNFLLEGALAGGVTTVDFKGNGATLFHANGVPQGESGIITVDQLLSFTITLNHLRDGTVISDPWSVSLTATAYGAISPTSYSYSESGTSSFGDTLSFVSVTLPDGSTPESHGAQLTFASGMTSPNEVLQTPEPSSLALGGIGLVFVGGLVAQRRKGAGR